MTTFIFERLDARLFPSRRRIALFRLVAGLRLLRSSSCVREGTVFALEPDQSAGEAMAASILVFVTSASYLYMIFEPASAPARVALAVATIIATPPLLLVPMLLTDGILQLIRRMGGIAYPDHLAQQWLALTSILTLVSAPIVMSHRWERWVAAGFLSIVLTNVIAFVILLPLAGFIARLERERGGDPFEL